MGRGNCHNFSPQTLSWQNDDPKFIHWKGTNSRSKPNTFIHMNHSGTILNIYACCHILYSLIIFPLLSVSYHNNSSRNNSSNNKRKSVTWTRNSWILVEGFRKLNWYWGVSWGILVRSSCREIEYWKTKGFKIWKKWKARRDMKQNATDHILKKGKKRVGHLLSFSYFKNKWGALNLTSFWIPGQAEQFRDYKWDTSEKYQSMLILNEH